LREEGAQELARREARALLSKPDEVLMMPAHDRRERTPRRRRLGVSAALASALLAGCAAGGGEVPAEVDATTQAACPSLPPGISGSPLTIADAVAMANALVDQGAAPLTIPCFVSRLDRPLTALGVDGEFSLQPGDGRRSPRMFAILGATNLVVSFAPAGSASDRVELAEYPTPLRSIKAEMAFPMTAKVSPAEPYDRIRTGDGTVCGGCHRYEVQAPQVTVTKAFESGVFKARPEEVVPVPEMQTQERSCDPKQEPYRCAMFQALFEHGAVLQGELPADAPTIYD
jgi:hypothetical protein